MATIVDLDEPCMLAFFCCEVAGVRLNQLGRRELRVFDEVYFVREPTNPYDSNSVLVKTVIRGRHIVLGHVAREAARWLSPLLLASFEACG